MCCNLKNHGLSISDAEIAFDYIRKMENSSLKNIVSPFYLIYSTLLERYAFQLKITFYHLQIWEGVTTQIIKSLSQSPADHEVLRVYLILPIYHEFINSKNYEHLHTPFARAVLSLNKVALSILTQWWSEQSTDYYERLVENYKSVVMHIITFKFVKHDTNSPEPDLPVVSYEPNLDMGLQMLKLLFHINTNNRKHRLSYEAFYLHEIADMVDLQKDFFRWSQSQGQVRFFRHQEYQKFKLN